MVPSNAVARSADVALSECMAHFYTLVLSVLLAHSVVMALFKVLTHSIHMAPSSMVVSLRLYGAHPGFGPLSRDGALCESGSLALVPRCSQISRLAFRVWCPLPSMARFVRLVLFSCVARSSTLALSNAVARSICLVLSIIRAHREHTAACRQLARKKCTGSKLLLGEGRLQALRLGW